MYMYNLVTLVVVKQHGFSFIDIKCYFIDIQPILYVIKFFPITGRIYTFSLYTNVYIFRRYRRTETA